MNQLGLFPETPRLRVSYRVHLVDHMHGYTPQAPARTWIGAWDTEAEAKREARKRRAGRFYAAHIEIEVIEWPQLEDNGAHQA